MIEINMQMPAKCGLCPCFHFENPMYCQAVKADKNKKIVSPYGSSRPEWCPLKEQESTLGIRQTVDGITFISTGTAKQGEERGLVLGKALMREWLEKELLYRGLLTDDIRTVMHEAKYL